MKSSPSLNAHRCIHMQKSCTDRLAIEFLQQQCQLILPSLCRQYKDQIIYVRNVAGTCVGQPENNVTETSSSRNLAGQLWPTRTHMHARQNKLKLILLAHRKRNINYRMVRKCPLMVDVTYSFEASLVVHEQSILGLHIQVTEAMLQSFTLHIKSTAEKYELVRRHCC